MYIPGSEIRYIPDSVELEELLFRIADTFSVRIEPPNKSSISYYDSFDWRLYNKKILLQRESDSWQLIDFERGSEISASKNRGFMTKTFAWNFPVGRFRSTLESVLDIRAAIRLVTLSMSSTRAKILNSDDKTVCYVNFEEWVIENQPDTFRTIRLEKIRGYEKHVKAVLNFLSNHSIDQQAPISYPFQEGVRRIGRDVGDYSSKLNIILDPEMTIRQAMIVILKKLFDSMMWNMEGIQKDYDTEFLHDFRISLRRTRSCLSQFKSVLLPELAQEFKEAFAYLSRITGPTRDLDVYLLYEENYKQRLPKILLEGLHTFFEDISRQRAVEYKKLQMALKSPKFNTIIRKWSDYLGQDQEESRASDKIILPMAKKIIYQRYRKIMKNGYSIGPFSADEELHDLRIQCKKLRYSLEIFSSLFDKEKIKMVIKQLKRLQTNLGDFNDLSVQQEMLREQLNSLRSGTKKNKYYAAAIGGLLTNLYHEQRDVRKRFGDIFDKFDRQQNVRLFKELFG